MLVVIKDILYEGAVALRASVNFRKDLRRPNPWGDSSAQSVPPNSCPEIQGPHIPESIFWFF